MKLTAVIIDDEIKAAENLAFSLKEYVSDIGEIRIYTDPLEGVIGLKNIQPDLLFLDIQMPHYNGFDLLKKIQVKKFEVVFTTAYSEYAIKAIEYSAFAYLLKPIDSDALTSCIERYRKHQISEQTRDLKYDALEKNLSSTENHYPKILTIRDLKGIHFFEIDDIIRMEASGNYTHIFMQKEIKKMTSKTMKSFETLLNPDTFIRVHHSHIVKLEYIQSYLNTDYLLLKDGKEIPTSRAKRKSIKELLMKNSS